MDRSFNETSVKKIKSAIDNNKLVVFVGAGVSAIAGLPNWAELIEEYATELGLDFKSISRDQYLKIPQYYHNERGFKEYFDVLKKKFSINYKPNVIHNLIFELNPAHIITTNYDRLIEIFDEQNGSNYFVVKKDEDLPYSSKNKMIIKMHGDIDIGNFVLREDDYLNYSINFRLIETFIKSLFATNLILFVGFSADDPNFNQIFNWVKEILKKDFQSAYLLKPASLPNYLEFNYFKNRGINILYSI